MAMFFKVPRCIFVPAFAVLLVQCAPKVTTVPAVESVPQRPVRILRGDTLIYQIAFADDRERGRFGDAFGRFITEQQFLFERYDSAGVLSVFRILPSKNDGGSVPEYHVPAVPLRNETPAAPDTAPPPCGGSLRLYYPRGSIDYPLTALVGAHPFRSDDSSMAGYFTVANSSPAAVTLKLARKTVNGAGRTLSAFDIIELWTRYIRGHPAEGLASFRFCDGITKFLSGQEAIVLGLSASDNSTVRIRLGTSDPQALDRLRSMRTLPAAFKLGSYTLSALRENDAVLSANRAAAAEKPFVNELTIRCGGDPNPLLSFSLGRYDAAMLWSAQDIDYSRRNLLKNSSCSLVGRDRYFVACNLEDSLARDFIRSAVSGQVLLGNFIKAEGASIPAVESDSAALPSLPQAAAAVPKPAAKDPLTILFRKDDAISKIIAERLLAAVTHAGVPGELLADNEQSYEAALVGRGYTCAVGWVPETVLFDISEKLRLAALFFNDEPDEVKRIRENREIPLFSIDWYLLAKSKVGLYKGKISGLYIKQESREK
jgi:hypothetical protein